MIFRSVSLVSLLILPASIFANEALDLLQRDPRPPNLYERADLKKAREAEKNAEAKKEDIIPDDPQTLARWPTELEPTFTYDLPPKSGLETIAFRGLLDYQMESGDFGTDANFARARLGFALRAFYNIELQGDAAFDGRGRYLGIETLKARFALADDLSLSVGKMRPSFTSEYSRDHAVRWFPQLSPVIAQIAPAKSLGALLEGQEEKYRWKLGYFSSDADKNIPGVSSSGRGGFLLAGLGGHHTDGIAHHRWHFDYLHNFDPETSETIPGGYRHLLSMGVDYSRGYFDFSSDFHYALGKDSDLAGLVLAGRYWLAEDALRLVARYSFGTSGRSDGILAGWGINGPEAAVGQPFAYDHFETGQEIHSFYLGLNFHLWEDNFLLGTGVGYRSLGQENGSELTSWNSNIFGRLAF